MAEKALLLPREGGGSPLPPLRGPVIRSVGLVDYLERRECRSYRSVSLPGHLLHFVVSGRAQQTAGGIAEDLRPGHAVWYFENEEVEGRIIEAPWCFFTVNFEAPTLSPPPLDQRVCHVPERVFDRMRQLLAVWREEAQPASQRHLRVHTLLLEIIQDVLPPQTDTHRIDAPTESWWEIEARLRDDLSQPLDLSYLQEHSRLSLRTLIRACHAATGLPPMKRVKQLRLSYARGLLQLTDLSMREIAARIGYGRSQEFSRDYRKHYGCTPSADRRNGPDYRQWDDEGSRTRQSVEESPLPVGAREAWESWR